MRKETQKRLLNVATLLHVVAAEDKSMWRKFFSTGKEPTKPTPESTLKDLSNKFGPVDVDSKPKPQVTNLPNNSRDIKDFAAFLSGKGGAPLEIANPLKQIGDALVASGTISLKDSSNIVMFLTKVLKKYLAGQKLAAASINKPEDYKVVVESTDGVGYLKDVRSTGVSTKMVKEVEASLGSVPKRTAAALARKERLKVRGINS